MNTLKKGTMGTGYKVHLFRVYDGKISRFPICGAGRNTTGSRRPGRGREVLEIYPVTCDKCKKITAGKED